MVPNRAIKLILLQAISHGLSAGTARHPIRRRVAVGKPGTKLCAKLKITARYDTMYRSGHKGRSTIRLPVTSLPVGASRPVTGCQRALPAARYGGESPEGELPQSGKRSCPGAQTNPGLYPALNLGFVARYDTMYRTGTGSAGGLLEPKPCTLLKLTARYGGVPPLENPGLYPAPD